MRPVLLAAAASVCALTACRPATLPEVSPSLVDAGIFVNGVDTTNIDCRTAMCPHNEDTDMYRWNNDIYMVHRTATSQVLGPNSSLHIYRSTDEGATFVQTAVVLAPDGTDADGGYGDGGFQDPDGRDIRDPAFYEVGNELHMKALTRLPFDSDRDTGVNSITVNLHTSDGVNWTPLVPIAPVTWSFWRIKKEGDTWYSAAYHDGDTEVVLFSSTDGLNWTQGANIYTDSAETPLETELTFMPSGKLLALVRTDGNDEQLEGDDLLQTQVCWADPPYSSFSCDAPLTGVRLDGPLSFFYNNQLFVVARQHLGADDRKRTTMYEITGNLEGGPIGIKNWFEFPSAGDTAYAGGAMTKSGQMVFVWYAGDLTLDQPWYLGIFAPTNIWLATVNFTPQ